MGASCRPAVPTAAALLVFALLGIVQVESNGSVEIRLHRFVVDGCCGLAPSVSFRICVRNYQATVNLDSPCIIGEAVTRRYAEAELQQLPVTFRFPFNFTWTGSFSFVVEAYNKSEEINGETMLVSRFVVQRYLSPKEDWHLEHLAGGGGPSLELSYRIKCEANYFGDRCDVHCKPRDDKYFGHYTCDVRDGHKVCMAGWKGAYCDIAICRIGCSEKYGTCKMPYECKCRSGWEGQYCDICSRYPGCQHGTCNNPWECNCNEGWGGLFCSEDLNYCTNHKPCRNGGTCTNTGQGSYTCTCSEDYMGKSCDVLRNPCTNNPCQNGGTCLNPHEGNYTCQCLLGFYGPNCETSASICTQNPCQNGGSCVHDPEGYTCACVPGFYGSHCENVASCTLNLCQNNGTCLQTSEGPICRCPSGFSGVHCADSISCAGEPCLNGGKCFEDSGSFRCNCTSGFTGAFCEIELHNCLPNPCNNGGTCQEADASYFCLCRTGFSGRNCSITDPCGSAPCQNGGTCKTDPAGFSCHCTEEHYGPYCEYSSVPHIQRTNAISNTSLQLSDRPQRESKDHLVVIIVCSVVGMAAFLACAICLAIKCFKQRRKQRQPKQISDAEEDELKQNERNMLQMNNKCVVPQTKIVNTLDRMPTKVNNEESVKVVNAQMENKKMPEKNILYMQRTLERRDNLCGSGNSGCHSQEWSPCNSGGVYVIQDHIRPLKVDDCYLSRPPLLNLVDNDKVFATEV